MKVTLYAYRLVHKKLEDYKGPWVIITDPTQHFDLEIEFPKSREMFPELTTVRFENRHFWRHAAIVRNDYPFLDLDYERREIELPD